MTTEVRKTFLITGTIGLVLLAYRLISLAIIEPGFFFDEAYYYGWSLTPDFGYYSKPPMVAWLIWATTHIFGVSEFSTKLGAPLLYLVTAYVVQAIATLQANSRAGFWAFSFFITMPFVTLNSWFITTDAPLLLFWALTTFCYLQAEKTDELKYWILAGIFGGLGLLSKYTMILLPAAIFLMYLFEGQAKRLLHWKFWVTIGVALAVFSPNVIWQFQNGFPSFIHTAELANKAGWDGNPHEFIPGQFLIFGPIATFFLLFTFKKTIRKQQTTLWYLSWAPLIIFALKSIQGEAFVNWAAFAYSSAAPLAGIWLSEQDNRWRKTRIAHWVISLMLMFGFYQYPAIQKALNIEPTKNNTPYARIEGWRELTQQVAAVAEQYPNAYVGSTNRTINAYLNYYLPNPKARLRTRNWDNHVSDHYDLFYEIQPHERPALWVSDRPLRSTPIPGATFKGEIAKLTQQVYPSYTRTLWVYLVE